MHKIWKEEATNNKILKNTN